MKSDIIQVDNRGSGFSSAIEETRLVSQYRKLDHKNALHLELCAEEMFSMLRSVTGEVQASFWMESEGMKFDLHLSTDTVMNKEQREQLISASSSRHNEAASTFLGRLRDAFEAAMASNPGREDDYPDDIIGDLVNRDIETTEWDRFEISILQKTADDIRISIRGKKVDMVVTKDFG